MPLITRREEKKAALKGVPVPRDIEERLQRGRRAMLADASKRRLYQQMWRGEQYGWVGPKGDLLFQDTVTTASGGKAPHRVRNKYPFIHSIVEGKVSAATQRVPGYEITPSTNEPEDANAAQLAEQVAAYGYDKWRVRRATIKTVTHALVEGEGFAMPYFDPNVGPFIETTRPVVDKKTGQPVVDPETGEPRTEIERVGQGEIKIRTFSANEVYWEPGCDFDDSPWVAVEQARPVDEVQQIPGFVGGTLNPDAAVSDRPAAKKDADELVLVTEYMLRPCPKYPDGRRLIIANGHVIAPPETYPCVDGNGDVLDEPVLHRLSYIVDPTQDRDRGLVELIVDLQRTINDCWNKLLEWKNRCLNPQMIAPIGSLITPPDDVPGAVRYYRPIGGQVPQWESPPPVPRELFSILEMAIQHMRAISADVDVQAEADVAARTAQAAIEQSRARWQSFLGELAEWHSRLMRHSLYLVQRHYTEERRLSIMGDYGPDPIDGFMGAQLMGQADVRVAAGSLESRSRQVVINEAVMFADRGWITPQDAMATIHGGVGSKLGQTWMRDIQRANHVIQTIKRGPDQLFAMRDNPDGSPGFMPRKGIDNVDVHLAVFSDWLKTTDWDRLDDGMREAGMLYIQACQQVKAEEQMEAQMAQAAQAAQMGMDNASKPQGAKPLPDQPAMDGPPAGAPA